MLRKALSLLAAVLLLRDARCTPRAAPPLWRIPGQGLSAFQDARRGLFVHWGPISQWGDEISFPLACESLPCTVQGPARSSVKISTLEELAAHRAAYKDLAKTFNPVDLDLEAMASLAYDAGMRYVTWVVVHCDGFSNFDTKLTNYSIMNTPYGKDLFGEVVKVFRAKGFRVGAYYCPSVWTLDSYWAPNASTALAGCCSPTYDPLESPGNWSSFLSYLHGQLTELSEQYQPDHFWIDSGTDLPKQDTRIEAVLPAMRKANPDVVVQVRGNGPFRDYSETGDHTETQVHEVYGSTTIAASPFEVPMTLAQQWAYNPDAHYKSAVEILWDMWSVQAHGGNLLINIGPDELGRWAPGANETLQGLSAWMEWGFEALDGSAVDPVYPYEYVPSTEDEPGSLHLFSTYRRDGTAMYIGAMQPQSGFFSASTGQASAILVPFVKPELLAREIAGITLLGTGADVPFQLGTNGLTLNYTVPAASASIGSYWSEANLDQAPCATRGCSIYTSDNYTFERSEGYCVSASPQPGVEVLPVNLWFNGTGEDNVFDVASPGEGYENVRQACYILPMNTTMPKDGLAVLSNYFSDAKQDRWTLASSASKAEAASQGYALEKSLGYVFTAPPTPSNPSLSYAAVFKVALK